jgi:hypothetical protein
VTRKRSGAKPEPRRPAGTDTGPAGSGASSAGTEVRTAAGSDAPITGVASGSLGTAANLDDTQVMRTADLQRAAAEVAVPAWLTEDAPPLPDEPGAWASGAVVEPAPDAHDVPARERVKARPQGRASVNVSRRTSALAGAAAGALLVLLVGAALLGNVASLTPNAGVGLGPPLADASLEPVATPTAEPTKEPKGCHGKGKGNDCKD